MKTRALLFSAALCLAALCLSGCSGSKSADTFPEYDFNPDTDWFHEAKVGAFMHFLPDSRTFHLVDKFDVVALADQLESTGVKVFEFTLGQNTGYYNAPNPVYNEICGYKAGERCARRDLPMELADELGKRGIALMLYLPCATPSEDWPANVSIGFDVIDHDSNKLFTEKGVENWSKVIAWWSRHYGDKVKGWWFDGGYTWSGYNWAVGREYNKAVKSGNPHAIATFNPGQRNDLIRHCHAADYTAGEINDLLAARTAGRWIDGAQAHVLSYLGVTWGSYDFTRFTDEQLAGVVRDFTGNGGVVMLDCGPNYDETRGPVGTIGENHVRQLRVAVEAAGIR